MHVTSSEVPALATLLKLGRVSNLPTVWTNALAGTILVAGEIQGWRFGVVLLAMSLFYVGGMYLNDYFDRAIDAAERPSRPIPAGEISAVAVAVFGFGMLGAGVALMATTGLTAALVGALLAFAIVAYDVFHKGNPGAPVVMGLCRALVYCGAAAAATLTVPAGVIVAALALLAYVAGLTYAARQENYDRVGNLWPLVVLMVPVLLVVPALGQGVIAALICVALISCIAYGIYLLARRPMPGAVPRAVGLLIAGISLVDAALLAKEGTLAPALVAMLAFPLTLFLQRHIPGT